MPSLIDAVRNERACGMMVARGLLVTCVWAIGNVATWIWHGLAFGRDEPTVCSAVSAICYKDSCVPVTHLRFTPVRYPRERGQPAGSLSRSS